MKRERDVTLLAVAVNPFDQQFQHAGLIARCHRRPQFVELGQHLSCLCMIDEFAIERDQLVVDFSQATFGAAYAFLGFRQARYAIDIIRHGGSDLQACAVVSELLLNRNPFVVQPLDSLFGLLANLADGFSSHSRIAPDAFDLFDHESLNLTGGNRRRRAFRPASLLRRAADVVAITPIAL